MWTDQRARVGTLRVRGADADVPALRLATVARLETAELALPVSAPPSAILLVRRLRDPLPGRFPRTGPPSVDRAWNRAAREGIAGFYALAARPRFGERPAHSDAVVFRDAAELLAVALLHRAQGGATDAWWWRALTRFLPAAAASGGLPLLLARPHQAAAALHQLFQMERETIVLGQLDRDATRSVLEAVVAAHALPGLPATAASASVTAARPLPSEPAPRRPVRATDSADHAAPVAAMGSTATPSPPWHAWLPSHRATRLAPVHQRLLGIALGLHSSPATLRHPRFWQAADVWLRHVEGLRHAEGQGRATGRMEAKGTKLPMPRARPTPEATTYLDPAPETGLGRPQPVVAPETPTAMERYPEPPADRGLTVVLADGREATNRSLSDDVRGEPLGRSRVLDRHAVARDPAGVGHDETHDAVAWPETGIESALGGVFYLIQVMRDLDLPDAFEADWALASHLGGWGTLDALARAVVGLGEAGDAAMQSSVDDPIWRLLAVLAGRAPDDPPVLGGANGYRRAPVFVPLAGWQDRLEPDALSDAPKRLHLLLSVLDPTLLQWLRGTIPFVFAALGRATRLRGHEAFRALIDLPSRLFASDTHIDVVASLRGIALPARRGGLDRDPGWVSTLGHIIQFHFR